MWLLPLKLFPSFFSTYCVLLHPLLKGVLILVLRSNPLDCWTECWSRANLWKVWLSASFLLTSWCCLLLFWVQTPQDGYDLTVAVFRNPQCFTEDFLVLKFLSIAISVWGNWDRCIRLILLGPCGCSVLVLDHEDRHCAWFSIFVSCFEMKGPIRSPVWAYLESNDCDSSWVGLLVYYQKNIFFLLHGEFQPCL